MAKGGQPRRFKSGQELIDLWQEFCNDIREEEYTSAPTQTAFGRWLAVKYKNIDRKTIYNSLNEYFPNVKKEFEAIRADVISEGTMLGKYQPTMSIFALKNWCRWTDKQEVYASTIDEETRNEVNSLVDELNDYETDEEDSN